MFDLTPIVRLLAWRRSAKLARMKPAETQHATLMSLVGRAAETRFGKDHDFAGIRSVEDFQARVPIRDFDQLWTEYFQADFPILDDVTWPGRIPFFARSSGTTTGRSKHLPITREIIKSNEKAGFDLMAAHLGHNPKSRPLSGYTLIVGGATSLEEIHDGIFVGDVSGINTMLTPGWIKKRQLPPRELSGIFDWDEKMDAVARAVYDKPITMISGQCNWMLMMCDRIRERREAEGLGNGPTFPDLQLMIHGGVPIDVYRDRLMVHVGGTGADIRELYPASEGFVGFADRGPGEGMRMMLDNGLFFEFVPLEEVDAPNPTRHWVGNAEPGVDYALILSNNAGLWSYRIGDVVRLVDTDPPRLHIMGRVSQALSPFGEHLIGAEIDAAVRAAADALGFGVAEYTVGPVMPASAKGAGYHVYILEPTAPLSGDAGKTAEKAAGIIDAALRETNFDYDRKRTRDSAVRPPAVRFVPPGAFEGWLRLKGKFGGQNKVPRVSAQAGKFREMADELGVALPEVVNG